MPEPDDDFETAVNALARLKGVSPADLKRRMLEEQLLGAKPASPPPADQPVRQPLSRRADEPTERRRPEEDEGETAAEAEERWYREEAALPDGVLGLGGSSAGGIFGDAPIATSAYDPMAEQRAENRVFAAQQARVMGRFTEVLERIENRLGPASRRELEGGVPPRRRLGR